MSTLASWFYEYMSLPEVEKKFYQKYKLEMWQKFLLYDYERLLNTVKLVLLDYEEQVLEISDRINIPNEIALLWGDEAEPAAERLHKENCLSQEQYDLVNKISAIISAMSNAHEKKYWTPQATKDLNEWDLCRKNAIVLLELLELNQEDR